MLSLTLFLFSNLYCIVLYCIVLPFAALTLRALTRWGAEIPNIRQKAGTINKLDPRNYEIALEAFPTNGSLLVDVDLPDLSSTICVPDVMSSLSSVAAQALQVAADYSGSNACVHINQLKQLGRCVSAFGFGLGVLGWKYWGLGYVFKL